MTVLFCDIRGFSRISERLGPQEIIRFLIAFLTPMCDILLARKATIDKFIGDAILSFWNAPLDDPDQHANAARAALAMTGRLRQINVEMRGQEGTAWPGGRAVQARLTSLRWPHNTFDDEQPQRNVVAIGPAGFGVRLRRVAHAIGGRRFHDR